MPAKSPEAKSRARAKAIERGRRAKAKIKKRMQADPEYAESQRAKQRIRNGRYRKRHRERLRAKQNEAYRTGTKPRSTKEYAILQSKKRRELLTDSYVLVTMGLSKGHAPPEVIELKRKIITLNRLTKKQSHHETKQATAGNSRQINQRSA